MNRFSIKDIENITGIKAHTIRIWEQRYRILQPKRSPTNIRFYDADDLKLALRISLLNRYGYKISRIGQMNESDMNALIQKISEPSFKLQILTNELLEAALAMDMIWFEQLLNDHIAKNGLEATIEGPVFQFLEQAGILWMTDHLIPAQEHLSSNVLYRKLAVAIDSLPVMAKSTRVLLFLPEGERHELALMYVHFLLLQHGKTPIYLGQNTPLKELQSAWNAIRPDYIYTHLTAATENVDGHKYLMRLSAALPDVSIFISGPILLTNKPAPILGFHYLYSLSEVREAIAGL